MALSNAERQARFRARQKERGLVRQVGWLRPDQHDAIDAFLRGQSAQLTADGTTDSETIAALRAELHAAHVRTDTALALVELFVDARAQKKKIDSDILARVLLKAAELRGELDVIFKETKGTSAPKK